MFHHGAGRPPFRQSCLQHWVLQHRTLAAEKAPCVLDLTNTKMHRRSRFNVSQIRMLATIGGSYRRWQFSSRLNVSEIILLLTGSGILVLLEYGVSK